MATAPPPQNAQACADEINFFELWGILWAKKLLILGLMAFCGFGGFLFVTYKPGEPDKYNYTALVEIGRYLTQTGQIQVLESPHDLVLILNQQARGVEASVPRGSLSVVSLQTSHVDPAIAKKQLDSALAFISGRHETLASRLSEKLLTSSGAVAKPTVTLRSIESKRTLIVAVSAIAGLLLGVLGAMATHALNQHKAGRSVG